MTISKTLSSILKTFFDETFQIPTPMVASADGSMLTPYMEGPLTVGNELNKLASNISGFFFTKFDGTSITIC